jgi:hypothetical protein
MEWMIHVPDVFPGIEDDLRRLKCLPAMFVRCQDERFEVVAVTGASVVDAHYVRITTKFVTQLNVANGMDRPCSRPEPLRG